MFYLCWLHELYCGVVVGLYFRKTYQRFPSTSASNSSLIFQITVPSENVVIDRNVLINTGLSFTMTACNSAGAGNPGAVPVGSKAFDYGVTDALQAFPLASLMTTATAQINNTTVSVNLQDVLPSMLRLNNSRCRTHNLRIMPPKAKPKVAFDDVWKLQRPN